VLGTYCEGKCVKVDHLKENPCSVLKVIFVVEYSYWTRRFTTRMGVPIVLPEDWCVDRR
jgi:hypothetical protein